MNFLQMKQDLADRLSAFDETVSSDATRLGRWLNRAQDNICLAWDWPFNRQLDIIQTSPDYTTGTASITTSTMSATLSSAPSYSVQGWYIRFASQADWYQITTHTASSTSLTISPTYHGDTISSGTFQIRKFNYALTSTALTIMDVKIAANFKKLVSIPQMQANLLTQMISGTGTPTAYFLATPASDGSPQIGFFPNPDGIYNIYVEEKFKTTEMSSDSDSSIIPSPYHDTIVTLASYYGFLKTNQTERAAMCMREYEGSIEEMKRVYSQDKGRTRVIKPIDGEAGRDSIGPTLPPQYGPMSWR